MLEEIKIYGKGVDDLPGMFWCGKGWPLSDLTISAMRARW